VQPSCSDAPRGVTEHAALICNAGPAAGAGARTRADRHPAHRPGGGRPQMAWCRRDMRHHRPITADPAGLWWLQRAERRLHLRHARRGAQTTGTPNATGIARYTDDHHRRHRNPAGEAVLPVAEWTPTAARLNGHRGPRPTRRPPRRRRSTTTASLATAGWTAGHGTLQGTPGCRRLTLLRRLYVQHGRPITPVWA
jgi:hypothetical protein